MIGKGGQERESVGRKEGNRDGERRGGGERNFLTFSCSGVAPVLEALSEPAKSTILSCEHHSRLTKVKN